VSRRRGAVTEPMSEMPATRPDGGTGRRRLRARADRPV